MVNVNKKHQMLKQVDSIKSGCLLRRINENPIILRPLEKISRSDSLHLEKELFAKHNINKRKEGRKNEKEEEIFDIIR